ncbi:F-box/kelch-repeat protein At3g06240-like [Solanum stenotomum]|uniref:F-box/kelch-repeat protein At3g06240-like n=1 Tax=Solanum stenotomum TaxID=172797 RepID=UPI0020D12DEC|nr:F-box/kelch-repeat protein At3g06240-like [Solanum stenotomum]
MLPGKELNGENSEGKKENSESDGQTILVCFDLIIEILLRLPVKSLLRCRYDEIHDDYKVVRICTNIGRQSDFQEVNIYSLKNDSWWRTGYPHNETRLISSCKFVNGKVHWATSAGFGYQRGWGITSFDLADEKWRKVEQPFYGERDGILMTRALRSNFSMFCNNSITQVDVWYMKEYGNKESWIKVFTINYNLDPMGYFLSQSFCLSKGGEFLVMFESTFMIYNPEDNSSRILKSPKFSKALMVEIYIERLTVVRLILASYYC